MNYRGPLRHPMRPGGGMMSYSQKLVYMRMSPEGRMRMMIEEQKKLDAIIASGDRYLFHTKGARHREIIQYLNPGLTALLNEAE